MPKVQYLEEFLLFLWKKGSAWSLLMVTTQGCKQKMQTFFYSSTARNADTTAAYYLVLGVSMAILEIDPSDVE